MEKALILIIDDEESTRRLLEFALVKSGYIVCTAKSGEEALKYLEKVNPNIMIVDMVMPGMGGYCFIKKIKNIPVIRNIPIIVSSGKSGMEDYFNLEDEVYRPDAFLAKPYKIKELLETVEKVI